MAKKEEDVIITRLGPDPHLAKYQAYYDAIMARLEKQRTKFPAKKIVH